MDRRPTPSAADVSAVTFDEDRTFSVDDRYRGW
jgi:hypothetical protein